MKVKIKFFRDGNSIDYDAAKYWVNDRLDFNIDLKFLWAGTKNFSYREDVSYIVDIGFKGEDWSYIQFDRDDGYYVIPTANYTIEQWLFFEIGSIVKIINAGKIYDSYYQWVDANAPQYTKFMWTPGNLPKENHKFKVITKAPWDLDKDNNYFDVDRWLYFIEDCETRECFLIDETGIAPYRGWRNSN